MPQGRLNLLSLQEAMDLLGVSRATVDRWRKDKQLPHIKIGKEIWIDPRKLREWVEAHALEAGRAGSGTHAYDKERRRLSPPDEEANADGRPSFGKVVTVGYQSGAALLWSPLIIRRLGLFEEELRATSPSQAYRVRWSNASNGMELVEKLIAGEVDIASVGDYPIAAGRELGRILPRFRPLVLAFDGKTRSGDGISLVARPERASRHPDELSGSAISTVGQSSASCRLRGFMSASGLTARTVVYGKMGDCLNGILSGEIEASVLWEPYLSWAQALGAGVPLASASAGESFGGDYVTGLMADGGWAAANKDVVLAYLKAHLRAHGFIRKCPEEAAKLIHESSGFPAPVVRTVLTRIRWDAALYGKDLQTLNRLGDAASPWLHGDGGLTADLPLGNPLLQEAAEALGLPALPDAPLPGEWSGELLY